MECGDEEHQHSFLQAMGGCFQQEQTMRTENEKCVYLCVLMDQSASLWKQWSYIN